MAISENTTERKEGKKNIQDKKTIGAGSLSTNLKRLIYFFAIVRNYYILGIVINVLYHKIKQIERKIRILVLEGKISRRNCNET